jgi:hypothetical protein
MFISKHGLSTHLFSDFFQHQFASGNIDPDHGNSPLSFNGTNIELTPENAAQVADSMMQGIQTVLERKVDPAFIQISNGDGNGIEILLTTKGLFRADAITALVSQLLD